MFEKKIVEKIETHVFFNNFFPENRAVYEIMLEKYATARQAKYDNIIRRIPCRITKATNTHSQHVLLIAFVRQQYLQERASMLRYMYIVCLVVYWCHECRVTRLKSQP